jgi:hypothetical protein
VCESDNTLTSYAILAPWISELIGSSDRSQSELITCLDCNFKFFSKRFNTLEMASIYKNYRGQKYLKARRRYEPWFSKGDASQNSSNSVVIQSRKDFMKKAFTNSGVSFSEIDSVLDFGGDLGQFIPQEIVGSRYLLDPSDILNADLSDVIRVKSLNEVPEKLGFIMNCHTLEHLPEFNETISDIKHALKRGCYFYLEIPLDAFKTRRFHSTNFYQKYLRSLICFKTLFVFIDFLSGVYRQFFGAIPLLGIVKQSEHINYFDLPSTKMLLRKNGFEVLSINGPDFDFKQGKIRLGRLGILSKKL